MCPKKPHIMFAMSYVLQYSKGEKMRCEICTYKLLFPANHYKASERVACVV